MTALLGLLAGCVNGGSSPPKTNVQNSVPVANAGADQTVVNRSLSTVNASASTDTDGDALSYTWVFDSKPAGSTATLNDSDSDPNDPVDPRDPIRTFTPDVVGTYVLQMTAGDGFPNSASTDTVTVSSILGPIANAGPDQEVSFIVAGTTVNLDGTASNDPTDQTLTYSWEFLSFSGDPPAVSPVLIGASTATPSFDITALDQLGTYTIQLTVNNGALSATDQVRVTVAKSFPTAGALLGSGLFASFAAALRRLWRRRISKAGAK